MGLFGVPWKDVVTGVASGVAFAAGGPVLSGIVGGAVNGVWTGIETGDWGKGLESGLIAGAAGMIPGGILGGATSGLWKGGVRALGKSFENVPGLVAKRGFGGPLDRLVAARAQMTRPAIGAVAAGVGSATAGAMWDAWKPTLNYIPTKVIPYA
ncbi:hypothetical protein NN3_23330 [Nocardia neocaledoniensis NBRC 108232]|uniref:Uncharacterized protein n=1 Tax=Nocardia neocaledoniensis TaxID=236511 RepID=A0A317N0R4_9NOCA|nr:hypothetical protein DFR69_1222 [Nocardia neocaledoniensis]GEM31326.1 hypothetical protein NN3_23330 [Nocardia neocaledoniensis NBRC 108232]